MVCAFGDTVMFTASGASTYTWSPSTGLDTTGGAMVNASPGAATTYTVSGTSVGGCVGTASVDLQLSTGSPSPYFTSSATTVCEGGSITFMDSSMNAIGYVWTLPGGTTPDSTVQNPVVTYSTAGTYDVTLFVFGCGNDSSLIQSGYITVTPGITSSASATICSSDSISLGGAYQNTAGTYIDTYVTPSGCDSLVTTTLSVDTAVSAGISAPADICDADVFYDVSGALGGVPGSGGTWSDDDGYGAFLLPFITPGFGPTGTFNFTYTVSGGGACPADSATVTLTIHVAPSAGNGNTLTACLAVNSIDITTGLGGTPDSGGVWTDLDASGALTGTIFDPSSAGLGSYDFSYSVLGNAGCPADTAIVTVTVVTTANAGTDGSLTSCSADFIFVDLIAGLGGPLDSNGTFNDDDNSGGFVLGQWSPFGIAAGVYNFTYTVTAAGCASDSSVLTMTIADAPDAGTGSTLNVCDSETSLDVATGLSGGQGGGTWSDDNGVGAAFSDTTAILDLTGLSNGAYNFTYTVVSPPCADATATVTVTITTCIGIAEVDIQEIGVYPNPSEGKFTIDLGSNQDNVQVQVFNATGELIAEFTNDGEAMMEIDLTGNPNGLYYINVIDGKNVSTTKVSIVR